MSIENNYTYDDNMSFENFEFSPAEYESYQRQPNPFMPPHGNNYPPEFDSNSYPPKFDSNNSPNFNYPGGNFNPPGMPKSPPPNYVPKKSDSSVQKMSFGGVGGGGAETFAVSANSIRFCLYKYTYIWEVSGRNYWAYLLNVNRRTVSGFRWFRGTWVYFGLDLRRIDSFVCYRSSSADGCKNCVNLNRNNISSFNITKEYSINGSRDVYTQNLASIDIPQVKEDFLTKTIGYVEDTNLESEIPCVKARNIGYRITLEVTYPSNYDEALKEKINELASNAGNDLSNVFSATRQDSEDLNPLETFNSSTQLIPEALKTFSDSFTDKIRSLDSFTENYKEITFSIRNEKIYNNWKPYFYNDSLF